MSKIKVTICTGTSCYLMGASHLLQFDEVVDPGIRDQVEIAGAHCLGLCELAGSGKAPFAKVNEQIIADATLMKILDQVRRVLGIGA